MSTIVVHEFITLDGVVQAPGGPDEDAEGGFPHGGWTEQFDRNETTGEGVEIVRQWESNVEALLLGRKTYDIWSHAWGAGDEDAPGLQGEFTRRYNRIPKYVASGTLTELAWKNSRLLGPDVPAAVRALRDAPGGEIRVWGSAELIATLAEHDLVDEYRLIVYPIVLGTGKRLFPDGFTLTTLALVESRALKSGVLINVYRRVR